VTPTRRLMTSATALVAAALIAGSGCDASSNSAATSRAGTPDPDRTGLAVAGYVVPWDARSRASAGHGVLDEVSPVWYQPTDGGAVTWASDAARSSAPTVTADAGAHGVVVAPSVSNFRHGRWDGALIARLITDPVRRSAHVAAIVDLVRSQRWPAIDIDYESLPASGRASYSAFIAELAAALHRVPARLSVTLHAKTAEPGTWAGAQAQDWRAIGAAADEVRVMAYDYAHSGSRPGPIAPPSWVDRVLGLATRLVPVDRIVLGLPTYGYDWATGANGQPMQWADVQASARSHDARQRWDGETSSPWLRYTDDNGREHTVWYENARSLGTKLDLAGRHGVTHVVLWRLGGEDPDVWPTLRVAR
jgi:spore germination protein